jgi:hypothetical protein
MDGVFLAVQSDAMINSDPGRFAAGNRQASELCQPC